MNKIFKNKRTFKYESLLWQFLAYFIGAILWNLWINLVTWSKPELNEIIETIVIFEIVFIIRTVIFIVRKHLISIHIDTENNALIINQLRIFQKNLRTVLNLNKLNISELKNGWFTYFELQDDNNQISISSSNYGLSEKKLKKIYSKLNTIASIAHCG
ncbi:hypothetical protein [Aquimarina sp. 2201CG5-10]|uniref:hypothetical protein n=1 Tax=Aquimarina callyspongiae TaxID=3098150 RepID=UPI002AB42359|nr:hypothetical protein [Aquimarina sp. 2201CG5-10]MDY8135425.1 hypothetical protein [Aquimarina sp. 2201CG5-10]